MPFPDGVTLVTVTGQVAGVPDGQPVTVKFVASDWLVGPAANAVMPAFTRYAVVNSDGEFSISLPATDDPAWTAVEWAYNVTLTYGDTSTTGTLTVPYDGGTFDLADRLDIGGAEAAGVTYMPLSLRSAAGGVAGLDVDGDVIDAAGNKVGEAAGGGISETIVNAKGDLIAATAADTVARLAVGSNGQYLTAASGQATGLQWDTLTAADISDSTATGRAVVTATDAAAARTAIDAQQLDSDLTTIAGLTATSDNVIQSVGGAWASRTPAQVKTALALGNVDNTSDANKPVSTATQTALDLKAALASPALTGTPTAPTAAGGTNTTQVATTAFVTAAVAGGGGGSTLVVKRGIVTSGNLTPQNTGSAWQALSGGPTLVIPAAVGDYIAADIMGMLVTPNASTFLDLAVVGAGAALVRFASSGTGTAAVEGDPAFYPDASFRGHGQVFDFVAQAGDIDGGNVTICIAVNSAGVGTVFASAAFPLRWRVLNHGAASVS